MWNDTFNAKVVNPWQSPAPVEPVPRPDFADNEELKKIFGIALAKGFAAFEAGLEVFKDETAKALWISLNWLNDPNVIAAKDAYLKSLKKLEKPLDKDELLAEVLHAARVADEDKDRATLYKLYSDIAGFTGKAADSAINFNTNTTNVMQIKLVGGSEKSKTIEAPNTKSKMQNDEVPSLPKLKLVGGSSR